MVITRRIAGKAAGQSAPAAGRQSPQPQTYRQTRAVTSSAPEVIGYDFQRSGLGTPPISDSRLVGESQPFFPVLREDYVDNPANPLGIAAAAKRLRQSGNYERFNQADFVLQNLRQKRDEARAAGADSATQAQLNQQVAQAENVVRGILQGDAMQKYAAAMRPGTFAKYGMFDKQGAPIWKQKDIEARLGVTPEQITSGLAPVPLDVRNRVSVWMDARSRANEWMKSTGQTLDQVPVEVLAGQSNPAPHQVEFAQKVRANMQALPGQGVDKLPISVFIPGVGGGVAPTDEQKLNAKLMRANMALRRKAPGLLQEQDLRFPNADGQIMEKPGGMWESLDDIVFAAQNEGGAIRTVYSDSPTVQRWNELEPDPANPNQVRQDGSLIENPFVQYEGYGMYPSVIKNELMDELRAAGRVQIIDGRETIDAEAADWMEREMTTRLLRQSQQGNRDSAGTIDPINNMPIPATEEGDPIRAALQRDAIRFSSDNEYVKEPGYGEPTAAGMAQPRIAGQQWTVNRLPSPAIDGLKVEPFADAPRYMTLLPSYGSGVVQPARIAGRGARLMDSGGLSWGSTGDVLFDQQARTLFSPSQVGDVIASGGGYLSPRFVRTNIDGSDVIRHTGGDQGIQVGALTRIAGQDVFGLSRDPGLIVGGADTIRAGGPTAYAIGSYNPPPVSGSGVTQRSYQPYMHRNEAMEELIDEDALARLALFVQNPLAYKYPGTPLVVHQPIGEQVIAPASRLSDRNLAIHGLRPMIGSSTTVGGGISPWSGAESVPAIEARIQALNTRLRQEGKVKDVIRLGEQQISGLPSVGAQYIQARGTGIGGWRIPEVLPVDARIAAIQSAGDLGVGSQLQSTGQFTNNIAGLRLRDGMTFGDVAARLGQNPNEKFVWRRVPSTGQLELVRLGPEDYSTPATLHQGLVEESKRAGQLNLLPQFPTQPRVARPGRFMDISAPSTTSPMQMFSYNDVRVGSPERAHPWYQFYDQGVLMQVRPDLGSPDIVPSTPVDPAVAQAIAFRDQAKAKYEQALQFVAATNRMTPYTYTTQQTTLGGDTVERTRRVPNRSDEALIQTPYSEALRDTADRVAQDSLDQMIQAERVAEGLGQYDPATGQFVSGIDVVSPYRSIAEQQGMTGGRINMGQILNNYEGYDLAAFNTGYNRDLDAVTLESRPDYQGRLDARQAQRDSETFAEMDQSEQEFQRMARVAKFQQNNARRKAQGMRELTFDEFDQALSAIEQQKQGQAIAQSMQQEQRLYQRAQWMRDYLARKAQQQQAGM